ncbi:MULTISPECIES: hypothetical protein [unclassified Arthrobacter]|uniref:hypothetical protein n=1 Tax=unclassified Arthrobacter TaxID=235627 RepID=UPI0028831CD3|nr:MULTISPECIES: hypothetical protein [unclassified Arthrobacter]
MVTPSSVLNPFPHAAEATSVSLYEPAVAVVDREVAVGLAETDAESEAVPVSDGALEVVFADVDVGEGGSEAGAE